jgi:hypothetical protein
MPANNESAVEARLQLKDLQRLSFFTSNALAKSMPRLCNDFAFRVRHLSTHLYCKEAVSKGPDGNRRMVPGEPTRTGGRAAENPQGQAPRSLPVLRATDELPTSLAVLSGGPSYLAEVAQPSHSWKRDDVGEICSNPTETPVVATSDRPPLEQCGESPLRNPLR